MKEKYIIFPTICTPFNVSYFIGANSSAGFCGGYEDILDEKDFERIYIVKGGPGTGKSTLMKSIASEAEKSGLGCEYYLCGSDPASLDAVIINTEKKYGVIDGTSPHIRDPLFPGAISQLVDLGTCWDKEILKSKRKEICLLAETKSCCFSKAYRYLRAADETDGMLSSTASDSLLKEKLVSAAKRLISSLTSGPANTAKGKIIRRYTTAVTMSGTCRLNTFEKLASRMFIILDRYGYSDIFLKSIVSMAVDRGFDVIVSPSPVNPGIYREIFIPKLSAAFILGDERPENDKFKCINMQRFCDMSKAAAYRGRYRFGKKCRETLFEGALDMLSEAKYFHFTLEEIYKSAMNFDMVQEISNKIAHEIIG